MRSLELIEHTADVGIRARGDTLDELAVACAEGMVSILAAEGEIQEKKSVEIAVEGESPEDLIHEWLRELLYRFDADGLVFRRFDVHEASDTRLCATCIGERFDPSRHKGGTEIKAVTYHRFRVERGDDGWTAEVLFDI